MLNTRQKRAATITILAVVFSCVSQHALAQDSDFSCDSATLFVNRLEAVPVETPLPDGGTTKVLAEHEFSGFAKFGIASVHLIIRFDPDPGDWKVPTGSIRVAALIRANGKFSETEIRYSPDWKDARTSQLDFLRARLIGGNPNADDPGSPAVRFQQAEPGVPVILITFTGVVAAGGVGDVDSHNAMVLDLRLGKLLMPAAIGCIDNDFAGQGAQGGSADCGWDHVRQDYKCATSDGNLFLISGKKIAGHRAREKGELRGSGTAVFAGINKGHIQK